MDSSLLPLLIGTFVIALTFGIGQRMGRVEAEQAEQRLEGLAGQRRAKSDPAAGILLRPSALELGGVRGLSRLIPSLEGLATLYEQANVGLEFRQFLAIPVALAIVGAAAGLLLSLPLPAVVAGSASLGALPVFWLAMRKRKRIKQFMAQMSDALELVGRALRAGHGLASGLHVVAEEMAPPIAEEFGRVFEEQNLGIPLEDALRGLAERVPTMDVRFFVTAVVIQRTSGGDLAEILDKIGRLIRERFQILGQVQALTAEGRLSGVVLLALPPGLLAFTYMTNPDYVGLLFTTAVGTKLLAGAAVLQAVGALAIKKIITIKV
jgi:tight adherence protein B